MKVKIRFKDYDLSKYSMGIMVSDMPLTEKLIDVPNSKSLKVSRSIFQVVDKHGNTDELFPFWEYIEIIQ